MFLVPEKYTATAKCTEKLILNTRSKKELKVESKSEELPLGCLFSPQKSLKDVTFYFCLAVFSKCLKCTFVSSVIIKGIVTPSYPSLPQSEGQLQVICQHTVALFRG